MNQTSESKVSLPERGLELRLEGEWLEFKPSWVRRDGEVEGIAYVTLRVEAERACVVCSSPRRTD